MFSLFPMLHHVEPWISPDFPSPGKCLQVACGHSHSMALVQHEESLKENVYAWGLGSSGQLGIPKEQLQDGPMEGRNVCAGWGRFGRLEL